MQGSKRKAWTVKYFKRHSGNGYCPIQGGYVVAVRSLFDIASYVCESFVLSQGFVM